MNIRNREGLLVPRQTQASFSLLDIVHHTDESRQSTFQKTGIISTTPRLRSHGGLKWTNSDFFLFFFSQVGSFTFFFVCDPYVTSVWTDLCPDPTFTPGCCWTTENVTGLDSPPTKWIKQWCRHSFSWILLLVGTVVWWRSVSSSGWGQGGKKGLWLKHLPIYLIYNLLSCCDPSYSTLSTTADNCWLML